MFKNYLKVAWRNIVSHKIYSFINIFGLAVGMACCLLIILHVKDELNFDRYNQNFDRIYRVACHVLMGGREDNIPLVPAAMAAAMKQDFPEVQETVRFRDYGSHIVKFQEKSFTEKRIIFADASLFRVFSIPLLQGDGKTALAAPHSIVISQGTARKYFGDDGPIGKFLRLNNNLDFQVTGLFREIPANSHFRFDLIASLSSLEESREVNWLAGFNFYTYALLRPGMDAASLEGKFPQMSKKYLGPMLKAMTGFSLDELLASGKLKLRFYLQPLRDIHLRSGLEYELAVNSDIKYIYIFSAIALLILVIAGINFVNMATARSAGRTREAGIRKVLGSERRQLIRQFLVDALLQSMMAMLLALILTSVALPLFNSLAGKKLSLTQASSGFVFVSAAIITLLTGLFAGGYPAWRFSAARPIEVLKGKLAAGVRGSGLRSALVVFQFTVSIALVIATLVVHRQLRYIQNKKLGFDRQQVLVLRNAYLLGEQAQAFKNEIGKIPEIVGGSVSGFLPVQPANRNSTTIFPRGKEDARPVSMQFWTVDTDYIKTLGMKIVSGRDFSKAFPSDLQAVIVNQTAAKHFGWADPLGQKISQFNPQEMGKTIDYSIIGVIEDFHFESLHNAIGPLLLVLGNSNDAISFRIRTKNITAMLDTLKRQWRHFVPGQPFEYSFLDDYFNDVYRSEQQLGMPFGAFSGIAILVACLGLLALASFMTERRTKEIGIRKTLGASVLDVTLLLSGEFVKWVASAVLIAWPLAYYAMNQWLRGFAYRTSIGMGIFILSALLALSIALATVSFHAIRAARANPVESLRYE